MNKLDHMNNLIDWAEKKGFTILKAKLSGYEEPKSFLNKTTNKEISPDATFIAASGAKHYSEIVTKEEDPRDLVTKWKFLSIMASMKNGKLHLMAPKGSKTFANNLVKKYAIDAIVHSI